MSKRNITRFSTKFNRYGFGVTLPLGIDRCKQSGAYPDQTLRVSIDEITVNGKTECRMTVNWIPLYAIKGGPDAKP